VSSNIFANKWSPSIEKIGYTQVPNLLLESQKYLGINTSELITLLHISRWLKSDYTANTSLEIIAKQTGLSHCTQSKNVKNLERKGLIKRTLRGQDTTIYSLKILVDKLNNIADGKYQNRAPPLLNKVSLNYSKMSTNKSYKKIKDNSRGTESVDKILERRKYEFNRR
jgi:DNA-binding MarR family transcriptional regulator